MRAAKLMLLSLGVMACDYDGRLLPPNAKPTAVTWMEWPAEVSAQTEFPVRLVMWAPCGWEGFKPGASADESAVTFEPYFQNVRTDVYCVADVSIVAGGLDTVAAAPGLGAPAPRTYEMRATGNTNVAAGLPVRTFGDVMVGSLPPVSSRHNVGGYIVKYADNLGCVHVRPSGTYKPGSDWMLENPSDTVGLNGAFVHGYIYDAATPVCGQTRVFHLRSRN